MNKLNITRPICFFDLETTGTDTEKDRIVSISIIKILPGGEFVTWDSRINPQMPIPPEASAVHGITDEMVKDSPTFKFVSLELLSFLKDCDLGGFNISRFDVPLLFNEFERVGRTWNVSASQIIDAGTLYVIQEPRTLSAAYKFYTGKTLEGAHDAATDNMATVEVFMAQLFRYDNLPTEVPELALYCNFGKTRVDVAGKFTYDADGDLVFTFGKNKDKKSKLEIPYVQWMLEKGDFNSDTKRVCRELIEANLPKNVKENPNNLFNQQL